MPPNRFGPRPDGTDAVHEFIRDDHEQWTLIRLRNTKPGNPDSITAEGSFKCLTCKGFVNDDVICPDCRDAIMLIRSAPHFDVLQRLASLLVDRPSLLRFFEELTDDSIARYYLDRITDAKH